VSLPTGVNYYSLLVCSIATPISLFFWHYKTQWIFLFSYLLVLTWDSVASTLPHIIFIGSQHIYSIFIKWENTCVYACMHERINQNLLNHLALHGLFISLVFASCSLNSAVLIRVAFCLNYFTITMLFLSSAPWHSTVAGYLHGHFLLFPRGWTNKTCTFETQTPVLFLFLHF
jgi:hypothetical protein